MFRFAADFTLGYAERAKFFRSASDQREWLIFQAICEVAADRNLGFFACNTEQGQS